MSRVSGVSGRIFSVLPLVFLAACGTPAKSTSLSDAGVNTGSHDGDTLNDLAVNDAFAVATHPLLPIVPNTMHTLLHDPVIVTIVAANDTPADGTDTAAALNAFSDAVPTTSTWAAMSSEYELGTLSSIAHVTGPAIDAGTISTTDIRAYVANAIAGDAGPAPNGNTIYLLYLPAGVSFTSPQSVDDGYHTAYDHLGATPDQIAAVLRGIPYYGETQLGQMTRVASHEIVEAATDPLDEGYNLGKASATPWDASVWQSWVGNGHVELGDLCEGARIFEPLDGGPDGGWELQREWSNAAAARGGDPCVPPTGATYYSAATSAAWYSAGAGETVAIPVVGWSDAQTTDWLISPHLSATNDLAAFGGILDGGVATTSSLGAGTVGSCRVRDALNNGETASVSVTVPSNAMHGDYVVFRLELYREVPPLSCYPAPDGDEYHFVPVGVFVP